LLLLGKPQFFVPRRPVHIVLLIAHFCISPELSDIAATE